MIWAQPAVALLVAALLGLLLVGLFGWRHPRRPVSGASLLFLLLLLFPLLWATALWTVPVGPMLYGAAFIPIILAGLFFMLVIAVLTSPPPSNAAEARSEAARADAAATVFGAVFWILVLLAAGVVVAGYLA